MEWETSAFKMSAPDPKSEEEKDNVPQHLMEPLLVGDTNGGGGGGGGHHQDDNDGAAGGDNPNPNHRQERKISRGERKISRKTVMMLPTELSRKKELFC